MNFFFKVILLMILFPQLATAANIKMEVPESKASAFDPATMNIYRNIKECSKNSLYPTVQSALAGDVCESVRDSEFCSRVAKEDRLDCNKPTLGVFNTVAVVQGCIMGVFKTVIGILHFTWTLLQAVAVGILNIHKTGEAIDTAVEYMGVTQLYLHNEYENALKNAESNFFMSKKQVALSMVAGNLFKTLGTSIGDFVSDSYQETGCMNRAAKAEAICKAISVLTIPSIGITVLLKSGAKGLKAVPGLVKKMNKAMLSSQSINLAKSGANLMKGGARNLTDQLKIQVKDINVKKGVDKTVKSESQTATNTTFDQKSQQESGKRTGRDSITDALNNTSAEGAGFTNGSATSVAAAIGIARGIAATNEELTKKEEPKNDAFNDSLDISP